jgi:hypothetical protein
LIYKNRIDLLERLIIFSVDSFAHTSTLQPPRLPVFPESISQTIPLRAFRASKPSLEISKPKGMGVADAREDGLTIARSGSVDSVVNLPRRNASFCPHPLLRSSPARP